MNLLLATKNNLQINIENFKWNEKCIASRAQHILEVQTLVSFPDYLVLPN